MNRSTSEEIRAANDLVSKTTEDITMIYDQ